MVGALVEKDISALTDAAKAASLEFGP